MSVARGGRSWGQPSIAPAKLGAGESLRQQRETRRETWWVQIPRRNGWPPAASESCVVIGDGGTKRRQRLLRPGASIPKETHRGGPRCIRKRGQQGDAVTAWRLPPDRGMWPRPREGPPNANGCVGDPPHTRSIAVGRPSSRPGELRKAARGGSGEWGSVWSAAVFRTCGAVGLGGGEEAVQGRTEEETGPGRKRTSWMEGCYSNIRNSSPEAFARLEYRLQADLRVFRRSRHRRVQA
jgi:hypothetical protein